MKYLILTCFLLVNSLFCVAQFQSGKASYYADKFEGRKTASGEIYRGNELTAAHPTLPFGTTVKVTNQHNQKFINVRINDRGPFVSSRIIDLSKSAAEELDFINLGVVDVSIEIVPDSVLEAMRPKFYSVKVKQIEPVGFGVQIMSLSNLDMLLSMNQDLIKQKEGFKVTIQPKVIQEKQVFALILGDFNSREEAVNFKNTLSIKYADSYVVDFSKF